MSFSRGDVPVAYSMVALADELPQTDNHLFSKFLCYWAAFNNIYATIAKTRGDTVELKRRDDGSVDTHTNGHVQIPRVAPLKNEREQIQLAFDEFSENLKDALINHPNTSFFLERTPKWQGAPIEFGYLEQELNGVLNVGRTIDRNHPVWSPIDKHAFTRYSHGNSHSGDRDLLAKQILFLIYTIRNNTFHGGKSANEANDLEVVRRALPLLSLILAHFINWSPTSNYIDKKVAYVLYVNDTYYIIEDVPVRVNIETGEELFSPETVEKLQQIVWEEKQPVRQITTPVYEFAS